MENEKNENLDSTNETVEVVTDDTTGESEVDVAKLQEINKKLFERAKRAEGFVKDQDGNWVKKTKPVTREIITPPADIEDERLELRLQGYSKDDVKFIMQNGGSKILEDKNSLVSIALNTRREQRRAEQAAQQTTNTAGLSEVERKYTPEQLKNMTAKELEKILPHA